MSKFILLFQCLIMHFLLSAQDTTTIQTFTWDNGSRRGLFQFPDDSSQSYRKILMVYNMRCHGARVGVGGVGCGEWDYSCNTFLTDSSRLDSNLATIGSYVISGFNGLQFYYTTQPVNTYYKLKQKSTSFTSVIAEQKASIGNGTLPVLFRNQAGAQRSQFLYTASEMLSAGMTAGMLSGLEINVVNAGNSLMHLKIRLKAVSSIVLNPESPEVEGFTEVYYQDTEFKSNGIKRFQFHTPFNWDGNSSIIVDISFTDFSPPDSLGFIAHDIGNVPLSIFTNQQERSTVWDGLAASTSGGKLDGIQEELTVSFWAFGTPQKQPSDGSLIEGLDHKRQRALNIH